MTVAAAVLFITLAASCRQVTKPQKSREPQLRATVVTIQTKAEPGGRMVVTTLTIAGDLARASDEVDRWRLFDVSKRTVTFVDEVARTFRVEREADLIARRAEIQREPLPHDTRPAQIVRTSESLPVLGIPTAHIVIRSGSYLRELRVGPHPAIPSSLFALMVAADLPRSPLAAMTRKVDEFLLAVRGFPLAEHAELPVAEGKMTLDRTVVRVDTKSVAKSYLAVPRGFKELPAELAEE